MKTLFKLYKTLSGQNKKKKGGRNRREFEFRHGRTAEISRTAIEALRVYRQGREASKNPDVLVVSHVRFWRQSIGSEQRIQSMLQELAKHHTITYLCTTTIDLLDAEQIYSNSLGASVDFLENYPSGLLDSKKVAEESIQNVEAYQARMQFRHFLKQVSYKAVIFEYLRIYADLAQGEPLSGRVLVDLHDVIHVRKKRYEEAGLAWKAEWNVDEGRELMLLREYVDGIVAIQDEEAEYLRKKLPGKRVLTVSHAPQLQVAPNRRPGVRKIGFAGSADHSLEALRWFLKNVWKSPELQGLELHLFGGADKWNGLGDLGRYKNKIVIHGHVPELEDIYRICDVMIDPAIVGSGLKIKCVEAITANVPLVASPIAAEGLPKGSYVLAETPKEFKVALTDLRDKPEWLQEVRAAQKAGAEQFKPQKCYKPLVDEVEDAVRNDGASQVRPLYKQFAGFEGERVLVLAARDHRLMMTLQQQIPALQGARFLREASVTAAVSTPQKAKEWVERQSCDRMLLLNPYISQERLNIYNAVRALGVPYTVYERGALPDAWFFDRNGFNADSVSYSEKIWNKPLNPEESSEITRYVDALFGADKALESQGKMQGAGALREKYGLHGKKILFVPFQRPDDTVIRYFSGSVSGVPGFCAYIDSLKEKLPDDWVIIGKRHPLEAHRPKTELLFVDDDDHIHDLLELCDAVLLINSGVGVLSLLKGKPTLIVGEAFYQFDGVNRRVHTVEEGLEYLKSSPKVDMEKSLRFGKYLTKDFYSFGRLTCYTGPTRGGIINTVTEGIVFSQVRGV